MHTHLYKTLLSVFVVALAVSAYSQESIQPLSANLQLNQAHKQSISSAKTTSIVVSDTLPFLDDFSYAYSSVYPTGKHWIDSSVYINTTFGVAPISLGVATFDGLNAKGYPYNLNASLSSSGSADKLTSRPINLQKKGMKSYLPGDSVYLSFYYQAMGRGDWPEPTDSISLDLYKPNQKKWVKVWGKPGYHPASPDTGFKMVMIALKDTAYYDSLFQFRFRNKATLSGSLDHWHVDFVYLNSGRAYNDTLFQDVTFAYTPNPFLKNYSKMPYSQYITTEFAPSFKNYLRNNDINTSNITYYYDIYNQSNVLQYSYSAVDNILPFHPNGYQTGVAQFNVSTGAFVEPVATDTVLHIKHYIKTSSSDFNKANDTLIQQQKFPNYYAYDDGSAEVGYYNNTYGAKMGVRYTINKPDTLKALKIYFDPITQGGVITASSFRLMIWNDAGNGPGSVVLRDSAMYPLYLQGNYNLMPTYTLTTCLPIAPGTYYFGIQQTTNQPLNVGFDKNTNHSDALYYDIGNGWTQSSIPGSLMINPVMGCYVPPFVGIKENNASQNQLTLFPNPAQNNITIKYNSKSSEPIALFIYGMLGNEVLNELVINNSTVDISQLPNGIYSVLLKGSTIATKKLIISR